MIIYITNIIISISIYIFLSKMTNEINFKLSQLDLRSHTSQGLNYSFSACSGLDNSITCSKESTESKSNRFARKKSKESTQKLRENIRSKEKTNKSTCSTHRTDQKDSSVTAVIPCQKQNMKTKTKFNNIYKLEHRNQKVNLQTIFGKYDQNARQKTQNCELYESVSERNKIIEKPMSTHQIRYLPMADVLNYNGKPIQNKRLIQKRLYNKIQMNFSYY